MTAQTATAAVNRFGLGARPGELAAVKSDPQAWLIDQLGADKDASKRFADLPDSLEYLRRENRYRMQRMSERRQRRSADAKQQKAPDPASQFIDNFRETFGADQLAELDARFDRALSTDAGFRERLVHFWSNHFAISIDKRQAALYAAPMEREAVRPNLLGHFSEMLFAVESHPGMLRYLDNTRSIGGHSGLAGLAERRQRRNASREPREFGLNENLAREILELHTLGVDGGYTQTDVEELARAITGWGVPGRRDFKRGNADCAFVFRAIAHEPGKRTLLGKIYSEDGLAQGQTMLTDLATHPATARHLAWKLARHFVADQPPPALVDRLAAAWRDSGGYLPQVYRVLVGSADAWGAHARKFKTPQDLVHSSLRTLQWNKVEAKLLTGLLARLGQRPFLPRSPAGFADTAADWNGSDALAKRLQVASALAEHSRRRSPLAVATSALGTSLDDETRSVLSRAESNVQGIALLFASPAFQWRI